MRRTRRGSSGPWVLLIVLSSLVALMAFLATPLAREATFLGGNGTLTYSYASGTQPITSFVITLPSEFQSSLVPDSASAGFTPSFSGTTLALSGGSLAPGQTLTITYHLSRYISPGNRTFTTVATTSGGQSIPSTGTVYVAENVFLRIITFFEDYATLLEIAGVVGLLAGIGGLLIGRRKPTAPSEEGLLLPGGGGVKKDTGTEPGTEPGTGTGDGNGNGKKKKKKEACKIKHYWEFREFTLAASVGEEKNPSGSALAVAHHSIVHKPAGEPIPMSAVSEDWHVLIHGCTCHKQLDQKMVNVLAIVNFEWEVSYGGGTFIRITGGPGKTTEKGDQVIYQPPPIDVGKTADIKVEVKALHADPTKPPKHGPIILGINMKVTNTGKEYIYEWWPANTARMTNVINVPIPNGPCKSSSKWIQVSPIQGFISATLRDPAVSNLPLERPSGECAPGDYVRFEIKADDTDALQLNCKPIPQSKCKPVAISVPMSDELRPSWSSTKGEFVKSVTLYSMVAIWHAPQEEGDVEISVMVNDSLTEFNDQVPVYGTKVHVRKRGVPPP